MFIAGSNPVWKSHDTCVWAAPDILKQVTKLQRKYGDCKHLFREVLAVGNFSIQHVVGELCAVSAARETPIKRSEELLHLLDKMLAKGGQLLCDDFERIFSADIFPVLLAEDVLAARQSSVFRSLLDDDWYFPDKPTLGRAFEGKVDIAKFSPRSIQGLGNLIEQLSCEERLLSKAVVEEVEPHGDLVRHFQKENELNFRLRFISW